MNEAARPFGWRAAIAHWLITALLLLAGSPMLLAGWGVLTMANWTNDYSARPLVLALIAWAYPVIAVVVALIAAYRFGRHGRVPWRAHLCLAVYLVGFVILAVCALYP